MMFLISNKPTQIFIGLLPNFLSLYNFVFLWNGFIWFISLLYSVVFLSPIRKSAGVLTWNRTVEDWVRVPSLVIER